MVVMSLVVAPRQDIRTIQTGIFIQAMLDIVYLPNTLEVALSAIYLLNF